MSPTPKQMVRKRRVSAGSKQHNSKVFLCILSCLCNKKYEELVDWCTDSDYTFYVTYIHKTKKSVQYDMIQKFYKELDSISDRKYARYSEKTSYKSDTKGRCRANIRKLLVNGVIKLVNKIQISPSERRMVYKVIDENFKLMVNAILTTKAIQINEGNWLNKDAQNYFTTDAREKHIGNLLGVKEETIKAQQSSEGNQLSEHTQKCVMLGVQENPFEHNFLEGVSETKKAQQIYEGYQLSVDTQNCLTVEANSFLPKVCETIKDENILDFEWLDTFQNIQDISDGSIYAEMEDAEKKLMKDKDPMWNANVQ